MQLDIFVYMRVGCDDLWAEFEPTKLYRFFNQFGSCNDTEYIYEWWSQFWNKLLSLGFFLLLLLILYYMRYSCRHENRCNATKSNHTWCGQFVSVLSYVGLKQGRVQDICLLIPPHVTCVSSMTSTLITPRWGQSTQHMMCFFPLSTKIKVNY